MILDDQNQIEKLKMETLELQTQIQSQQKMLSEKDNTLEAKDTQFEEIQKTMQTFLSEYNSTTS